MKKRFSTCVVTGCLAAVPILAWFADYSNKLLIMLDGRGIYNPIYGGV